MDENTTLIVFYGFFSLLIGSFVRGVTSFVLDCFWPKPIIEDEFKKVKQYTKNKGLTIAEDTSVIFHDNTYFT